MSVLIKGMELPTDCDNCSLFDDRFDYPSCNATGHSRGYNWNPRGQRMPDCPLIEVPPHGDLIDKDATMNEILEERGLDTACWFAGIVNDMPAVIPADKDGEENG